MVNIRSSSEKKKLHIMAMFVLFEIGLPTLLVHSYVVQMDTDEIKYIIQCT